MATTKAGPSLGSDGKILGQFIPTNLVTDTELSQALDDFAPTVPATTSAAGVVELATSTEAAAGTSASLAVTPAALAFTLTQLGADIDGGSAAATTSNTIDGGSAA